MISLDGPDESTIDSQRGSGVFQKSMDGINMIRASGLPFGLYCTVTSFNIDKLSETLEFDHPLGGDWIKFNHFKYAGPCLDKSVIAETKKISRAAEMLYELRDVYPHFIYGSLLDMQIRLADFRSNSLCESSGKAYSCGGGVNRIAIFPNGDVTPCDHLPDTVLGNLSSQSLYEILNSDNMQAFTDFISQKRIDASTCMECQYIDFCTGGCPIEAINSNDVIGYDRHSCLKLLLEMNGK